MSLTQTIHAHNPDFSNTWELNLDRGEQAPESAPYTPETEEAFPEPGERDKHRRVDRMNDEDLFEKVPD